jgi:pilus assembly protein CpaB
MNRRLGLIALAVVLALVGTVAVFLYAKGADDRAVEGLKATPVLIVDKTIPAGTSWSAVVSGDYVKEQNVPAKSAPEGVLSNLEADVPDGQVASADIKPGQLIVRAMFGEKAPETGVLNIPDRYQAITIAAEADAEVGGYVRNGSEVAIYAVFEISGKDTEDAGSVSGDKTYASKLLLPRVSVIAVNLAAPSSVSGNDDGDGGGLGGSGRTDKVLVTLAVDQTAAERIVLAQKVGQLYLTLLTNTSVTKDGGGRVNIGTFNPSPLFVK